MCSVNLLTIVGVVERMISVRNLTGRKEGPPEKKEEEEEELYREGRQIWGCGEQQNIAEQGERRMD